MKTSMVQTRVRVRTCARNAGVVAVGLCMAGNALAAQTGAQRVAAAESSTTPGTHMADGVLEQLVTIDIAKLTLRAAVDAAAATAGARIVYKSEIFTGYNTKTVSLRLSGVPLRTAFARILAGTRLSVVPAANGALTVETRDGDSQRASIIFGQVTEAKSGNAVADATVILKGTKFAARTSANGRFQLIDVPAGTYSLSTRRLGHLTHEQPVTVGGSDTVRVKVQLTMVPSILQGVVTTGAGDRSKIEVGNSISTINADSVVESTPIRNVSDLIKGRVAGVDVMSTGGTAGAGSRIRIRGQSSLMSSEDPVVIVDGVRFDAAYTRARSSGYNTPMYNSADPKVPASSRLNDIDPESIESIDVLKGPAASALYGSDAANGVIVIKTKRGKAGPTRWSLSGSAGRTSQEATYMEPYFGWGKIASTVPSLTTCTLANIAALSCTQDSVSHFNPLNYKDTSPFKSGNAQDLNGQVSGGNDRQQYFAGASYHDELGMVGFPSSLRAATVKQLKNVAIPSWADRPNVLNSMSLTTTFTSQFSNADLALTANGVRQYHRDVAQGSSGFVNIAGSAPGFRDTLNLGWRSPSVAAQFLTKTDELVSHGYGTVTGNWRPFSAVTVHGNGGIDYSNNDQQQFLGQNYVVQGGATSHRSHVTTANFLKTADGNVTLDLPVTSVLGLRTTGGTQFTSTSVNSLNGYSNGLPVGSTTLSGAATNNSAEFLGEQQTLGWYLQETANLNQRLFLTVAIRGDKSSAFGGAQERVNFPKWNASWLLSEEPFFPKVPGVNSLRFRIGFGHAGANPPFDGQYRTYRISSGFANGATSNVFDINSVGNSDILPERSVETEGGFDLGMFEDRLTMGITLADKVTRNALMSRTLPPSFGPSASQVQNLGKITNRNFEIEAAVRPLTSQRLSWSSSVLLTLSKNNLVSLGTAQPTEAYGAYAVGAQNRYVPGYPVDGVWTRAILSYKDINENGIIEASEVRYADSSTYAGKFSPTHTIGWQNNVSLFSGMLSVGANFTYLGDALQYNSLASDMCRANVCRAAVDQSSTLAQQVAAVSTNTTTWAYLEHVSSFRFEELAVTMNAPLRFAKMVRAQRASFSVMGRNLKFWSHYRGADPEVNTSNQSGDYVADAGGIVQPRTWTFRVNLGY